MSIRRLTDPIRSILFNIVFYLLSILYFLIVTPVIFVPGSGPIRAVIRYYCLLSLFLARWVMGIRIELRGRDLLPPDTACVMAAAHQSYIDPMLAYQYRENLTAFAKKELFKTPLVGPLLAKFRAISVDRKKGGASQDMDDVVTRLLDEHLMILVYPQATRRKPGERGRLKSGAYFIQESGALPVYTVATNSGALWSNGFWHHSGLCVFEIVRQLPSGLSRADFMQALHEDLELRSEALMRETGFAGQVDKGRAAQEAAEEAAA